MVEDGVVDATFHDEPIAQVLPSSPFFALSPPTYTKYELAYPCGNDANTGRCRPYNSVLSLEKKNCTQACPRPGQAWPGIRIRKIMFCVDYSDPPLSLDLAILEDSGQGRRCLMRDRHGGPWVSRHHMPQNTPSERKE